jgi:hypothetical protein
MRPRRVVEEVTLMSLLGETAVDLWSTLVVGFWFAVFAVTLTAWLMKAE